jgi:spore germination protein KA
VAVLAKRILKNFYDNLETIRNAIGNSSDLVFRPILVNDGNFINVGLFYIGGLSDKHLIEMSIIEPILQHKEKFTTIISSKFVKEKIFEVPEVTEVNEYTLIYKFLLTGHTVIFIEGCETALAAATQKWEERGVDEPTTQVVIRGPKEAFTENISVNTALVRRKIKDIKLWLETKEIGTETKTSVSLMYLKGTADEEILNEVRRRLEKIKTNAILESGYIEEFIQDSSFSPFPTVFNTERPDVIAAGILEGRIAILIDGTPFVLLVPALFTHFIQSAEDYYSRSDFGFIRILRLIGLFIALLAPAIYIALTTYHQETIPTILLVSLAAQREGVPFPAFFEAILMAFTFEILREAGIRMPRMVGQALSIVGALVIGQAVVEAGFISAAMVIVVSITAISSFIIPSHDLSISIRLLRFIYMILAATFGFFGITIGLIALILHATNLKSFSVPYLTNFAPLKLRNQKDNLIRLPRRVQRKITE